MKTPITYYGGKQVMATKIVAMIPAHNLYCEPFIGGAAIFFAKDKSGVEVINDTNKELVNFYRTVQNDFVSLEKEIKISLHSRDLHRKASVVYNNPDMFTEVKRAWAFWVLAQQSFSAVIDGSWAYGVKKNTSEKKVKNKRESFTEEYAIRLQEVQVECTDALRVIKSRDRADSFFYCDPPYYNADMGHYDGYTLSDFEGLLKALSEIKGKFLLSSYPSDVLTQYTQAHGWRTVEYSYKVVAGKNDSKRERKKVEVLTFNYELPK